MSIYNDLVKREEKLSLVGLGYVGMPIAVAFAAKGIDVIGYDLNKEKIELYKSGIDPTKEVGDDAIKMTTVHFTSDEKDLMLIAILFHDTHKLGVPEEKYTRFDHPLLAANFIMKNQNVTTLNDEQIDFIAKAISSHMGQWNTSPYSDVVLPVPSDKYQFLVHKCDFLSSRKYINVDFNEKGDIIK